MNEVTLIPVLAGIALSSHGQGTLIFANDSNTLVKVGPQGMWVPPEIAEPVPVNGGFVQLLWAPAGSPWNPPEVWGQQVLTPWLAANPAWQAVPESITPIGPTPGRFDGGTLTLPTSTPGAGVEVAIIGWTGNVASFDAAVVAPESTYFPGSSFHVDTGNPLAMPDPELPVSITGPGQFTGMVMFTVIPEPSSMALFGLSATAWFMSRRRR